MNPYTYVREVGMPDPINISEVVASFYSELTSVASDLNAVSDELGKSISQIDTALKMLNLGITVWTEIRGGHGNPDMGDETYWTDDIGYTKFGGRWGICLRHIEGDDSHEEYKEEIWLFNDAPRALRLAAIDYIVGLLQKLTEEGVATTQKIKEKLADAQEVAEAVTQASRVPSVHLKKAKTSEGKLYQPVKSVPFGGMS
jgi:hypothetical protein